MLRLATKFKPEAAAFETAVRVGFQHAELWTDATLLLQGRELARLARQYPLGYAFHFPNRLEQPPEVLHAAVQLYHDLDARAMVLHAPHFVRHGEALLRLDPTLNLAVENHRIESLDAWAATHPGLALDVEHLWMYGNQHRPLGELLAIVRDFLHRHSAKLHHVHLPGYLPGQPEHRPMYCSRDLARGMWELLAAIDFNGLIVSEVNEEFQNEYELRMDVLLFQQWQEQHERCPRRLSAVGSAQVRTA
jgi:sugar phosphate isomerase/epimerase